MYIVALTGGIGSGKTEASKIFAALGVPVIDLDIISHQLTAANAPLVKTIVSAFGNQYLTKDAALNRNKMRELIFNNDDEREKLNAILHPAIYKEAIRQLQTLTDTPYTVLSIPLLTKSSPYLTSIDRILTIDSDEETQINRVKLRNQLSKTDIKKIMAKQTPRQMRLEMSDDVIENNGNIEEFREKVKNLHQKYIKTCIVNKTIS